MLSGAYVLLSCHRARHPLCFFQAVAYFFVLKKSLLSLTHCDFNKLVVPVFIVVLFLVAFLCVGARWPSGNALHFTRPQIRGSSPGLGAVHSAFHPISGLIK